MDRSTTPGSREASLQAEGVGSRRIAPAARDTLVHPDAAPLQAVPKDEAIEGHLANIENLLGQGRYGAVLQQLQNLDLSSSPLAGHYQFSRGEKLSRALLGIGDRYFLRGDTEKAKQFYQQLLQAETADDTVKKIAGIAGNAFDTLLKNRRGHIESVLECIRTGSFDQWCAEKKGLHDGNILDLTEIRQSIAPDFNVEAIFGSHPPFPVTPGYIDPPPPEAATKDIPTAVPGSVFRGSLTAAATPAGNLVPASIAMPLMANIMAAKARLLAIDQGLTITGQVNGSLPVFRYEYLRDKAKETATQIRKIESRMYPIQFNLDDFAEIVDAIRRPLAEQKAELEAINQRINGLASQLADLAQAKKAVDTVVIAFEPMADQCDCDWWCWTLLIITDAAMVTGIVASFIATMGTSSIALGILYAVGAGLMFDLGAWSTYSTLTCQNVGEIESSMKAAQKGLEQAIKEDQAELTHALATRDIIIANINALENELSAVYQSNAARVLDAKTLDLIQAQYNSLRQSLLSRAQTLAAQAQDAFNFERDLDVSLIADSYGDSDRKGYTSAETLLRDLDGLDYIDLTGRTQKAMQLSQVISLRKHYPVSFLTLRLTGGTRFTTSLKEFDRWFPGTYLQRIKEIKVEVLTDDKIVPVRGYLSNDGVSIVRFLDTGNSRPIDDVTVFAEPDADLAKLCYKRLQRRRHVDTMAFPEFASSLYDERMATLQQKERNFFENIGLESSWIIQFLPDQPIDLAKVSDVRLLIQYEAYFDENLKALQEKKRYTGRTEATTLPIGQLLREEGKSADFSGSVTFTVPAYRFEAPGIEKKIVNVGFLIKPKGKAHLEGAAEMDISYDGAPAIHVTTNDKGVLATATNLPAGTGLSQLEAMAHGKGIDKEWTLTVSALPAGLSIADIEEIYLLLNYEYSVA